MHVGSCFLFVGQHALCLQGVESDCATSWTVAWWCEEVQVVAEESGNLQQNMWRDVSYHSLKKKKSLARETLIIIYISQNSAFVFSLKLTGVFTAERWLHRQVSGMINVWATEPFSPAEMITLTMQLAPHIVCQRAIQCCNPLDCASHRQAHLSQRFAWFTKRSHLSLCSDRGAAVQTVIWTVSLNI